MEKQPAYGPSQPAIVIYEDPSLGFPVQINRALRPIFAQVNTLRYHINGTEGIFRNPSPGIDEAKLLFGVVDLRTKTIMEAVSKIDDIREGLSLGNLTEKVHLTDDYARLLGWSVQSLPAPKITLGAHLSVEKLWDNISSVQHDIQQPITAVSGNLQLLGRRFERGEDFDIEKNWKPMIWAYNRLHGFIQNWEKAVNGEFPKEKLPVDQLQSEISYILSAGIKEGILEINGHRVDEANKMIPQILKINTEGIDQSGLFTVYSIQLFRRLMGNIGQNFARLMKEDGKIWVDFNYDPKSKEWSIILNDNLGGLSQELWDEEEKRFRFKKGVGTNQGGEHIGMANMVEILELYGGSYNLENNNFKGTTQIYKFKAY